MPETALATRTPPAPNGVEKAAILLATLGPEAAAGILRHLSEHEVRQVSAAIARLRSISHGQAAALEARGRPGRRRALREPDHRRHALVRRAAVDRGGARAQAGHAGGRGLPR